MKVDRRSASTVAFVLVLLLTHASTTVGQWLNYPTPGLPRTPDRKPNLSAPAPRTLEGKPDLSGLWWPGGRMESDFKPSDAQPWAAEGRKRLETSIGYDSWSVRCLPPGSMINFSGGPFRIIQTSAVTAMLYEMANNYRQIFTDGRSLPKDPNPTWQGYSVGRWDGDTFVVETIGFNDRSAVGRPAYPHTEALRFTERYRRRDFGHIDLQITIDDRKTFTRAWTMHSELLFAADDEMLKYVCNENEKDRQRLTPSQQTSGNPIDVDLVALRKYTGTYDVTRVNGAVARVVITLEGSQLMLGMGGRAPAPLVAQSATMFASRGGVVVEFIADERGEVTQLIAHAVEGDMKGVRTEPPR